MRLFPQLGSHAAKTLYEELDALPPVDRTERVSTSHPAVTWAATGAPHVRDEELQALREELVRAAGEYGFPGTDLAMSDLGPFDRRAARILHDKSDLHLAEASTPAIWSFLALVVLPDLTWWRARGSTNVERFVCSDLTRHTWARLWQRAHLLTFGAPDPEASWALFERTQIGEAALDQIQTRRVAYGQLPSAFRALLRLYESTPDRGWFSQREGGYLASVLRYGAFLDFRALTEDELYDELGNVLAASTPTPPPSAPNQSPAPPASTVTSISTAERNFEDLPLEEVMELLVNGVRAQGHATEAELVGAFETASGVQVPDDRRDLIRSVAWEASFRNYLDREESTERWVVAAREEVAPRKSAALADAVLPKGASRTVRRFLEGRTPRRRD